MPRLRRLNGAEVIRILETFGFSVARIKGSHHILVRNTEGHDQSITVPVHGRQELAILTLRSIYRSACRYIEESELRPYFYTD
jgi:predicted RNA binding protein YcfA (HicA-like mRNA interferase family)